MVYVVAMYRSVPVSTSILRFIFSMLTHDKFRFHGEYTEKHELGDDISTLYSKK